jgi:hypothetical protein
MSLIVREFKRRMVFSEEIHSLIPNSILEVIEDSNHSPFIEER